MRCTRANRGCGGYDDGALSIFRLYEAQEPNQVASFKSTARKCSLPVRVPLPGTDIFPEEILPSETSEAESNVLAMRCFFYDYCIISTNPNISRGFLSGLEMIACRLGPKSDLAKACQAVSLAGHGKPLNRPKHAHKAGILYQELLGSMARAMESPALANATESRLVAMLLGLYEVPLATTLRVCINLKADLVKIIITNETDHGNHEAHAKGLAALMKTGHSPLNLLGMVRSGQVSGPGKNFKVSNVLPN